MNKNFTQLARTPQPKCSKGNFIIDLFALLERTGHKIVYLRNYEQLPNDIGNDVDILVERGHTKEIVQEIWRISPKFGWHFWKEVRFSCHSVFLFNDDASDSLHIDLFEQIEWHFVPFANADAIISRRVWQGLVFTPLLADELYLNIFTRLVYHGVIRDKHKSQWKANSGTVLPDELREVFTSHLPRTLAEDCLNATIDQSWGVLEGMKKRIRVSICVQGLRCNLILVLSRILEYAKRTVSRLFHPPGLFITFEGADGVGKSTIIEKIIPRLESMLGVKETLFFHWKPTAENISVGEMKKSAPHDPREKGPRNGFQSIVFLCYHWLTFCLGYARFVLPQRARNRIVVADRYTYDILLDPRRFRLNLPKWLLRVFVRTLPQADVVLALVAKPETIVARKHELSIDEINDYQNQLESGIIAHVLLVNADASPGQVAQDAFSKIASALTNRFRNT